jgi:hypothetical protein
MCHFVVILKVNDENSVGSVSLRYGSENSDPYPDPYQNVIDQGHWEKCLILILKKITSLH